ncbi:GspMb/PilO family protein [Microvirga sp. CF3016]|uniref:GspMb/PilO family protein n=1 Tax=Microvirga sp. CF3016 TaxID=3110181 RepID=UPI002E76E505|nr:GspMb/PilO family protein [Microvirga sp. CF3016]MEE1611418.1 GspMb/PilO family protein [Microvirga sp. CF3016]
MKHSRPILIVLAAIVLACIGLVLAKAGSDRHAILASTYTRLNELRAQRLDPRDMDAMKRALAAAPDPQTGLLIASDAEAASRLEGLIRAIAQDHNADIQSISLMVQPVNDKLPAVRGKLHLTVSDGTIGSFLKALETGPPAIFFDLLRITHSSQTADDGETDLLDLTASVVVHLDAPAPGRPVP